MKTKKKKVKQIYEEKRKNKKRRTKLKEAKK